MIKEPIEAYHSNPAISHSKLELFRRRPVLYYKRYIAKTLPEQEQSPAFRMGSAVHCAVLETKTYHDRYATKPEGIDRRTKEGKAAYAEYEARHAGKTLISSEEQDAVDNIYEEISNHPVASQLLGEGLPELTWRTKGPIALQCRTDWFRESASVLGDGPLVVDLKTTESLDDEAFSNFERSAFKFGYHRQAGFYCSLISELTGKPVTKFAFLVVEKQEPYGIRIFSLSERAIILGQEETVADLKRIKNCLDLGAWPNLAEDVRILHIPKWYGGQDQ
jgi:hypothetical protein